MQPPSGATVLLLPQTIDISEELCDWAMWSRFRIGAPSYEPRVSSGTPRRQARRQWIKLEARQRQAGPRKMKRSQSRGWSREEPYNRGRAR